MLDQELEYFAENRAAWLEKHAGRVVVVKGRELVGFFDNEEQALSEGARRFGLTSFLVRRVEMTGETIFMPALALGLLRAI